MNKLVNLNNFQRGYRSSFERSYRTVYHGTSKEALASILREGLRPAASKGADAWASEFLGKNFASTTRQRGVYLSTVDKVAATFSQFAAQVHSKQLGRGVVEGGVILEIDFSQADPGLIEADEQFDIAGDDASKAMVYHAPIPPSWIKSYCEVHPKDRRTRLPVDLNLDVIEDPPLVIGEPVKVAA